MSSSVMLQDADAKGKALTVKAKTKDFLIKDKAKVKDIQHKPDAHVIREYDQLTH